MSLPLPTTGPELRPARVDDAPAISALIHRFSEELIVARDDADIARFAESISVPALTRYLQDPRYRYIVASEGGGPRGGRGVA